MKPLCELCGSRHELYQAHVFATNKKPVVVNVVVNARKKDRHKKTPERLEYVKQKMREYRAKRAKA